MPLSVDTHIARLFSLLREYKKIGRNSRVLRFFGFKSSMGQAQFPSPTFSITHLFEPSAEQFSSDPIKGGIMMAQGVFLPSDVNEIFAQDDLLRIYLDKTFPDHINALE